MQHMVNLINKHGTNVHTKGELITVIQHNTDSTCSDNRHTSSIDSENDVHMITWHWPSAELPCYDLAVHHTKRFYAYSL